MYNTPICTYSKTSECITVKDSRINKKLKPYQALVLLIFGIYDWVERDGAKHTVQLGPFSRHIRVPNYRLIQYLRWLEDMGFISEFEHTYGKAEFLLSVPEHARKQPEYTDTIGDL